jgi:hypothetical protein
VVQNRVGGPTGSLDLVYPVLNLRGAFQVRLHPFKERQVIVVERPLLGGAMESGERRELIGSRQTGTKQETASMPEGEVLVKLAAPDEAFIEVFVAA